MPKHKSPLPSLNIEEIASVVSAQLKITFADAERVVNKTIDVIGAGLSDLRRVRLRKFGTLDVVVRNRRYGRSPHPTGGDPNVLVEIPAHYAVKFKPSRELKARLIARSVAT